MNSNIEKLKGFVNELIEKTEDKEILTTLTRVNDTVNAIDNDYKSVDSNLKEVMKDYKELIKHTSYVPREEPNRVEKQAPNLNDIINNVISKRN